MKKSLIGLLVVFIVSVMTVAHAEEAIFAMGCFWCGESEFRNHESNEMLPGILSLRVGYAGGSIKNPTYENHPGSREAVKIVFDPRIIPYSKLLEIFWHNVDLFDAEGQFCDKGFPYTAAIFFTTPEQQKEAELTKAMVEQQFKQTVKTQIIPATTFYDAEEYHQDYANKNPTKYKFYRWNCGRDQRLENIWKNDE